MRALPILLCVLLWQSAGAETLHVATAANFRATLEQLAGRIQAATGHSLVISSGATGALYTQILHGAPYDLLLAADSERPRRLVEDGYALPDSLTTYTYGKLVLAYHPREGRRAALAQLLAEPGLVLAIANPDLAPYGQAAEEVLSRRPLAESARLLRGANVGQAFQMWYSGGADAALVAASFQPRPALAVPFEWYTPIAQQAVILSRSERAGAARQVLDVLRSDAVQDELVSAGYIAVDKQQPDD